MDSSYRLFICHASEDQEDFVRPLAEALRKEYTVWYSEYQLTLGDRLLQKIDQGLASCDFGIVVLSKPFFEKKWPRNELDGLFARETQSRKIILPIWKDVTEDEVKAYSPILAGRMAVSTTAGLPKVLEKIRLAVNMSERQRELTTVDAAAQRVQALRQTVAEKQRSEQLLRSEQGVATVSASIEKLWETIQTILSAGADESAPIKFGFRKSVTNTMYVSTIRGMCLGIHATNVHLNSVSNTILEAKIFKQRWNRFGQSDSEMLPLRDADFKPTFRAGDQLVWVSTDTSEAYGTEELATHLVNLFVKHLEEEIATSEE